MIKPKDTKADERSTYDKKLDQLAIVVDKTKDKIDDEIESEYVINDEINSYGTELIHDDSDYFDGYDMLDRYANETNKFIRRSKDYL